MAELEKENGKITLLTLKRLKYLNSCIMESLRLYPSGPFIGRKSRSTIVLDSAKQNLILPSNINYIIFIQHMHMNPNYFKCPEKFYPERFMSDLNSNWMTPSAFMPFCTGIRMCLGKEYGIMQQKLFLINLLSKYSIKSLDNFGDCKPNFNFLLSPAHFSLKIERR